MYTNSSLIIHSLTSSRLCITQANIAGHINHMVNDEYRVYIKQ